jgi:purine-binding chemotaxis protein CheW
MKTDEEILEARARLIAGHRIDRNERTGSDLTLVEFSLAPERYAVEEHFVREVLVLKELTPLPGVPAFVAGITNIRGRIVSVLNLKILLGIKTRGITELNRIIILKNNRMEFGILTDAVLGISTVANGLITPSPVNLQGTSAEYVKGITAEGLILLDCERILSAREIIIDQKKK